MEPPELRQRIEKAKTALLNALLPEGGKAGADFAALVEDRVVSKGERSDGGKFSSYSTKPVPAYFYFGRSRNASGERQVRAAAKNKQGVSYRDFRTFNGLNTGFKNFQFTGEMWQNFGVRNVQVIGKGLVRIEIGGKNERSKKLLGYHSDRENSNLSEPSQNEIKLVVDGIRERLTQIIQREL